MTTTHTNEMKIYVAAPFIKADEVRDFHRALGERGFGVTSDWAHSAEANGPEDLVSMRQGEREEIANHNDECVANAHAVVALCYRGLGKEMFCECTLARLLGKPVVWVGDPAIMPLSAFRRGSVRVTHLELALQTLVAMKARALPEIRISTRW